MLDWARVEELRDEIGAEDFAEVVELFLEEVGGTLDRLEAGSPSLEADLHFLKGAALNLGFADVARRASEGEALARRGGTPDLAGLGQAYAASRDAFMARMAEAGYLAA